jgi:hypothetical protein
MYVRASAGRQRLIKFIIAALDKQPPAAAGNGKAHCKRQTPENIAKIKEEKAQHLLPRNATGQLAAQILENTLFYR